MCLCVWVYVVVVCLNVCSKAPNVVHQFLSARQRFWAVVLIMIDAQDIVSRCLMMFTLH